MRECAKKEKQNWGERNETERRKCAVVGGHDESDRWKEEEGGLWREEARSSEATSGKGSARHHAHRSEKPDTEDVKRDDGPW